MSCFMVKLLTLEFRILCWFPFLFPFHSRHLVTSLFAIISWQIFFVG